MSTTWRRRAARPFLVRLVFALSLAAALTACRGGDGRGIVSGAGTWPETAAPNPRAVPGYADLVPSTTAVPVSQSPATTAAPASVFNPTVTPPPPTTVRPAVPLPADPAAIVLSVSVHGGFPLWSRPRVQPIQLHAGGRLVHPEAHAGSSSAYRRLLVAQVPVPEVQALVAAAEDAGATSPPADLGHDPRLADGGVMVIEVDRPGLRSTLAVRDAVESSVEAPNLTPDQRARRRLAIDLYRRLATTAPPSIHLEAYVELVAYGPPPSHQGTTTTTTPTDLRTWPGAALQVGTYPRCFVLPFAELERKVPGWSTSTLATVWQSGSERLRIDFFDAAATKEGCGPPPA